MKSLELELEQYTTLRAELAGTVEGPQIMLYYSPDCVRKTLYSDVAEKSASAPGRRVKLAGKLPCHSLGPVERAARYI